MSSEQACPGNCNRHYREIWAAYKQALADYDPLDANQSRPDQPSIQPWQGDPWCGRCKTRIRETLAEFDILAPLLAATADGHRASPGGERVSGSAAALSPSQAGDDLDELVSMLSGWEDAYRDFRDWPSHARRGHLAAPETECINWLMRHLNDILIAPFAVDFGNEIIKWHREFKDKTKAGVRKLPKPMRCTGCHLLLAWTEGDSYVSCANCHLHIPLAEYEAEVARLGAALERGELDVA